LEEKLVLQKLQKKLEAERNQQRRSLFDQQDAIDARRETLIGRLEEKLNKRTVMEDLFTIRWSVV
jgi:adenine-specific DNA-methyltransferase